MIPLVPLGDRLMVRPIAPPDETPSGLALVRDTTPETMGTVLAKGVDVASGEIEVGDTVLFGMHAGQEVVIDGDRVFLLHEADILAVYEEAQ